MPDQSDYSQLDEAELARRLEAAWRTYEEITPNLTLARLKVTGILPDALSLPRIAREIQDLTVELERRVAKRRK
jgi:hypothetical protein